MKKTLNNIENRYKVAVLAVIIFGLLSHGMGIFNKYSYYDDVINIFNIGATYTSGRWMLDILGKIETFIFGDGHYSMPLFNGFATIMLLSICSCLVIKILDIKNELSCILVGMLMVCFPTIASLIGFVFTAHFYSFGLLIGLLGTYFICFNKNNYIYSFFGILLIACSIGVYQAFIPTYLSLMIMYLVNYIRNSGNDYKCCLKKIVYLLISVISFMMVYYLINKLYLFINKSKISDYLGMDKINQITIFDYIKRVLYGIKLFVLPISSKNYYMYHGSLIVLYYLILVLIVILSIKKLIFYFKNDKKRFWILVLVYCGFPVCINFIFVMSSTVHSLMVYSQVFVFIFLLQCLEEVKINNIAKNISLTLLFIVSVMYCRYDNRCYLRADLVQNEAIAYFTSLSTRIQSIEDYNEEIPVVYVNARGKTCASLNDLDGFNDIETNPYHSLSSYINSDYWQYFMKLWCGYSPISIMSEENFKDLPEVQEMGRYPNSNSIKIINSCIVVKF